MSSELLQSSSTYTELMEYYGAVYGGEVQRPSKNNFFKKSALPNIKKTYVDYLVQDADIKKFQQALIKDTPAHRAKLFLTDNTATSYASMSSSIMVGEGIIVSVEGNEDAENIINTWNDKINVKGQTIESMLKTNYTDNLIHGESLWRVYKNPNATNGDPLIDVQRVSTMTLKKEVHPTLGCIRWLQRTQVPEHLDSKTAFYRRDPTKIVEYKEAITIIPNEYNCCLHMSLFSTPPTSTILNELLIKRWSYWFLRKYIEKYWAPFIIAYIGDPKNGYMPSNPQEMKDNLKWAATQIRRIRDFGGASFPATTHLEVLDTKSQKQANIYLDTIDHLSKEIAIGLHASIAMRDPEKKSKAGQDIALQGFLRTMRGFREEYIIMLRRFYAEVLLPAYGINGITARDIKITFPEIKTDNIKDVAEAVEKAAQAGSFKDWTEIRKIFHPFWKHLNYDISKEDAENMKKLFLELNSPSRAEGDVPQQRAGSTKAKPSE